VGAATAPPSRAWLTRDLRAWFLDAIAWAVAILAALAMRLDLSFVGVHLTAVLVLIVVVALCQLLVGVVAALYRGRFLSGSLEEIRALGWATGVELIVFGGLCLLIAPTIGLPRSLMLIATPMAACLMLAIRYLRRLMREHITPTRTEDGNTLVYGAGSFGAIVANRMVADGRSPFQLRGFLDDDPNKANLAIRGVRVLGTLADLPTLVPRLKIRLLVVAINDAATPELMDHIAKVAAAVGIQVKVAQPIADTLGPMRDITIDDLIGRPPVQLDLESIADYLKGKRVLVTGAGGSIGSELCVQISQYSPATLVMLDHDETHLQDTEFELFHEGLLERPELEIGDIRDRQRLQQVFEKWRPQVVFHAAALKHVPVLQRTAREAWETNVLGTRNVLLCAQETGVEAFVNISTDKAADPTTILGHSKRMAERLTSWMAEQTGQRYCSVRFGNVLGSRGSAIPLFKRMIERGYDVTLTDYEADRYFMSIREACSLVIQAGAVGSGGDVLILDMGTPVKMIDIIARLGLISGNEPRIRVTGLRKGEKVSEVLTGVEDGETVAVNAQTTKAKVPGFDPAQLSFEAWLAGTVALVVADAEAKGFDGAVGALATLTIADQPLASVADDDIDDGADQLDSEIIELGEVVNV
jgi:dTDP-glucose 4,6-dehydratase